MMDNRTDSVAVIVRNGWLRLFHQVSFPFRRRRRSGGNVCQQGTQMNVLIRAATVDDVAVITEFNCRLAVETENQHLERQTVAAGVRQGLELGDEVRYFVAEDETGVIGQIMLTREWSDWRNGWMIWLQSVYVAADKRGVGVFRMLFDRAVELTRLSCNAVGVRLYVEHENEAATATYRKLGFRDSGYLVMEKSFESE